MSRPESAELRELRRRGADRPLAPDAKPVEQMLGPQTDDELHAYLLEHLGIDVPRTAACSDHDAPFGALADFYFERVLASVWLGPRGGSKTFGAAILHWLNSRFKPACESLSVGATLEQSKRAYGHLMGFIRREDENGVDSRLKSETRWANGSVVEIVSGSENACRGPHPQKVHVDEMEQMDAATWEASRLMSRSKGEIAAQDLVTSTRAYAHSPMDKLVQEIERCEDEGIEPPYKLARWCIFECAQPVENCGDGCGCEKVVKGTWDSGKVRTFADVCGGKLKRSSGWIPLSDLHKSFRTTSRAAWESEMECRRPSTSGLILPEFTKDRHGLMNVNADPMLGNIYMACDFGGTDLSACVWVMVLKGDLTIADENGQSKTLRASTRLVIDSLFRAEISYSKFCDLVIEREKLWRERFPCWRIAARWGDTQAKAARLEFREKGIVLMPASRDVTATISEFQDLVNDGLFIVDLERNDLLVRQLEAWRFKPGTVVPLEGHDKFDDLADACRYCLYGIKFLERQRARQGVAQTAAGKTRYQPQTAAGSSPWVSADVARYAPTGEYPGP